MKSFGNVFKKISFSPKVMLLFSGALVDDICISKKEKILKISMIMDDIIDEKYLESFKKDIIRQIPGIKDVDTIIKYKLNKNIDLKEIIEKIYKNILYYISNQGPLCKKIIENAVCENDKNRIFIKVKNNTAFYLSKKGLSQDIENKLKEQTGLNFKIFFKDAQETISKEEYIKRQLEKETELIGKVVNQSTSTNLTNDKEPKKENNVKSNILIGREIKDKICKIVDSRTEGETLTIAGNIFNVDIREIKGEKYIVSFDITDLTDSTTVKFFIEKDKFNSIKDIIKNGEYLKVKGLVKFDKYLKEINMMAKDISVMQRPPQRMDNASEKRVELHLHTHMSSMDGLTSVKEYIKRAQKWGHKAIAITDHGVVQAFPDAMNAAKGKDIKVIYGVEAYLIDDLGKVVIKPNGQKLDSEFIVFDIETTGLSKEKNKITEIGAVKIKNGKITEFFSTFINPEIHIPEEITKLTNITDDMVKDAPKIDEVLPKFLDFCGDSVLVAHNSAFDVGFIKAKIKELNMKKIYNTSLDTVELSKMLLPQLKNNRLETVCEALKVSLEGHHRAVNDAQATAECFIKMIDMLKEKNINSLDDINANASQVVNYKKLKHNHAIILVKNYAGLRNLYKLISKSHIEYFFRKPRIPKSEFIKHKEGLIIGSACEAGELYRAILNEKPEEYIESIVNFYDYLEIQPVANNMFMIESPKIENINSVEDIQKINKKIVELGEQYKKIVVATCDVHFIDEKDNIFRKIIMSGEGFSDADKQPPLFFRTTDEMLKEFEYLGEKKAKEVVIENTNKISDMIEKINPIPNETFPPKIEGAEEQLRKITNDKAISIYGNPLPEIVKARLDKELNSIIKNGYSVLYIIAQKLVWKSNEDGYLVGSRGSVGSSFVATMAGITEVNPLQPHYICPKCKYSDFNSDVVKAAVMEEGSGCDMPDKVCPVCGTMLKKEGHDIPFETFLGFDGDKEPDIDLNFSGEYQQQAHTYTEELFGEGHVFKAGTIGTLADKTAYGYVKKYMDERNLVFHNAEVNRLVEGCTGVKRTTGQHPGGLMIVPSDHDIYEFCPIQRPANDMNSNITTTHFDYHSISGRLLKLDLLGHDDPTIIRMLYDLTGVNPQTVSLGDKETMSLFESPKALKVTPEDIGCETGTLGIPEFGTKFVRQMLLETKPRTFSDLVRISGLSHGTDVWINNAQNLIEDGTITLKQTISTRDSIMIYLVNKGVEKKKSFKIMEKVRKGKGLDDEDIEIMKAANVPNWYIKSCQTIKYMFPKAHAVAYVMMAFRIAYFKINYPEAYYASYFTIRACDDFDYVTMCKGVDVAKSAINEIHAKGQAATTKDKNKLTVLEVVVEFYMRGFKFLPIDLYKSDAKKFIITSDGFLPPLNSLQGLGVIASQSIVDAREEIGEFRTIEEFRNKTSVGKTLTSLLKENGILKEIPETNQLSLFN